MDRDTPQDSYRAASRHSVQVAAIITAELDALGPEEHEALQRELRLVQATLQDALSEDPRCQVLQMIQVRLTALCQAVLEHMQREDQLLFPWLRSGRLAELRAPVRGLRMEHQSFTEELDRLATFLQSASALLLAKPYGLVVVAATSRFDTQLRAHMATEDRLVYAPVLQENPAAAATAGSHSASGRGSADDWPAAPR